MCCWFWSFHFFLPVITHLRKTGLRQQIDGGDWVQTPEIVVEKSNTVCLSSKPLISECTPLHTQVSRRRLSPLVIHLWGFYRQVCRLTDMWGLPVQTAASELSRHFTSLRLCRVLLQRHIHTTSSLSNGLCYTGCRVFVLNALDNFSPFSHLNGQK